MKLAERGPFLNFIFSFHYITIPQLDCLGEVRMQAALNAGTR